MEIREVTFAPGYFASDDGHIFSERRGERRPLRPSPDKDGYLFVTMMIEGKKVRRSVASLVAFAFVGPRPEGQEVCHGNGTRTDNRADNLSCGTRQENVNDARRHGTLPKGERNGRSRLTREQVVEMRSRVAAGEPQSTFVNLYGMSQASISYAVNGKTWCD